MAMQVNILEAKNQLSRLVKAVQAGEVVVIAHRGVPAARLVPIEPLPPRELDPIEWLRANPLPSSMKRTQAEINADLLAEREGWD
jgi:prevent-host-death family protein